MGRTGSKSIVFPSIDDIKDLDGAKEAIRELLNLVMDIQRHVERDIRDVDNVEIPALESGISDLQFSYDFPIFDGFGFTWNTDHIEWSAATVHHGGNDYDIAAGSATAGHYWLWWSLDGGDSQTQFYSSATAPTLDPDYWIVAFYDTSTSILRLPFVNALWHGGIIQANTITADQIASNTITATQIAGSTITTSELNFTPLISSGGTGAIIATINASAEGIDIDADNINISGATTFAAGYDPTEKVDETGGSYDTSAGNPRVRIFPDANTGIVATDSGGNKVFEILVGGANAGDVTIGDYAGSDGCFWDESAGTFYIRGTLNATDLTAGTVSTDRLVVADLDLISCTDLGTGIISGHLKSQDAKIDIDFDNSIIKIIDAGGVDVTTLGGDGLRCYDGSIAAANLVTKIGDCNYASYDGGIQSSAVLFGHLHTVAPGDISGIDNVCFGARASSAADMDCWLGHYDAVDADRKMLWYNVTAGPTYDIYLQNCLAGPLSSDMGPVGRFEHGDYTGSGAADAAWTTKYTFSFVPSFVIIQREDVSLGEHVGVLLAEGSAAAMAWGMKTGSNYTANVQLSGKELQTKTANASWNGADDYHVIGFG